MLSLVIEPHWSVVAYWLLEGLLSYTTNMPPEREASPNLQHYNLAIEKARGWEGGGKRSCHGAQWVQSLWLECWKDCLVSVINGGELGGRSKGEAYVARLCNLNAQQCGVLNESKACLNLITELFSFFPFGI